MKGCIMSEIVTNNTLQSIYIEATLSFEKLDHSLQFYLTEYNGIHFFG